MIGVWLAASDLVMRVSRFPQTQMSSLRGAHQEQSSLRVRSFNKYSERW